MYNYLIDPTVWPLDPRIGAGGGGVSERSAIPDRRRRPENFVGLIPLIPSGRKRGLQLPGGVASHCRLRFEYKYLVEFAAVFDAALSMAGD